MGSVFDVIDTETGEKRELSLSQKKTSFERRYIVLFQEQISAISRDRSLGVVDHRILLYLIAAADYENRLWNIRQKMICEDLALTEPQVSKSIKKLVALTIIEKSEHGLMSLSMDYFWKGKAGTYKKAKNSQTEQAKKDAFAFEE